MLKEVFERLKKKEIDLQVWAIACFLTC
jgi:hypothetical protein